MTLLTPSCSDPCGGSWTLTTALGRAASGYVQARLVQLPVAQTLDFLWFQALASVSALRNANDPPAVYSFCKSGPVVPARDWAEPTHRDQPP